MARVSHGCSATAGSCPATRLAIDADLERLENGQEDDGGWRVDFANYSLAAELEWRGHMTVRAVAILKRNGRL